MERRERCELIDARREKYKRQVIDRREKREKERATEGMASPIRSGQ
jgi:hypothetical protein